MAPSAWILKVLLALIGAVVAAYVFEEVFGGDGALAWMVCGGILAATVGPLFQSLFAWRRRRDAALTEDKKKGGNA